MGLSARNKIKGVAKEIKKGEVAALVKIECSMPADITAVITKEAVEELGIKVGEEVTVVIKATEVMIYKE
ncbi:MAG: TOBE domain protein [Candidatus Methanolliviera sp. GoM_oil]|nr:MAG: TOBE domain protein [Candidatus Methanolliviera sp. GoM_oil]